MIALLSPAMNMRETHGMPMSVPRFLKDADTLAEKLSAFAPYELEGILHTNPAIALRAFSAYQDFSRALESPAILSFYGLAYQSFAAETLTEAGLTSAQDRVRILSALYGVLRPLDGIKPYRLEMQNRFYPDGKSLYAFWGNRINKELFAKGDTAVNLMSAEYAKVVLPHILPSDMLIDCVFLCPHRGKLVIKPTEAKLCRGRMARLIAENDLSPEDLKRFDAFGYRYHEGLSSPGRLCFVKDEGCG